MSYNYDFEEEYGYEEFVGGRRKMKTSKRSSNSKKEAAKKEAKQRRNVEKFLANAACQEKFGMSVKEKRKADLHKASARRYKDN